MLKRTVLFFVAIAPTCGLSQVRDSALQEPRDGVTLTFVDNDGSVLVTPEPQLFGTGFDMSRILTSPTHSDELELSDDQKVELEPRLEQVHMRFLDECKELKKAEKGRRPSKEQMAKLRDRFQNEVRTVVREVLLPIQMERLEQIESQHNYSNTQSFPIRDFAKRFGLSEEQQSKLAKLTEDFDARFQQEVAALRIRRVREMFDEVLTDEQMHNFDKSMPNRQAPTEQSNGER